MRASEEELSRDKESSPIILEKVPMTRGVSEGSRDKSSKRYQTNQNQ
jgi:hypothetical protein